MVVLRKDNVVLKFVIHVHGFKFVIHVYAGMRKITWCSRLSFMFTLVLKR